MQYASSEYVDELKRYGFKISMARADNPYENAMIESFFKTLKYEEVTLYKYETFEDVVTRLPYFIEEAYNSEETSFGAWVPATREVCEISIKAGQQ